MAAYINGDNQVIDAASISLSNAGIIVRDSLTANSNDTLDTAENIILDLFGINDISLVGNASFINILNNSDYIITLGPGTGIIIKPEIADKLLPKTIRSYVFIITGVSLADVFLYGSGSGINDTGLYVNNGSIIVGNSNNIGKVVPVSGSATLANTGTLTLSNTGVIPGIYVSPTITVNSEGRLTNISTGSSSVKTFRMYGPSSSLNITGNTSYTTITSYASPVYDIAAYSYSSGVITILIGGTYQVTYTMQFNSNGSSGSQIGSFQSRILQNGSGLNESVTQSSLQRIAGTNNTCNNSKVYQIACAVNDTLSFQYAELNTSTVAQLTANQTVVTILNVSGLTYINSFRINGPSSNINITGNTAYTTITSYSSPTYDITTYSYSGGVTTVLATGTYQVTYTMQFNSNGNSGSQTGSFQSRILHNGISIDETVTQSSLQRLAGTNNTCNNSKVYQIDCLINDTISLQYAELNTSTVAQLTSDQTTVTIIKIK
jgi:hypothetical protein